MAVPVLFLVVLVVFHAAVLAADALAVHGAAREGARAAATGAAAHQVRAVVRRAVGDRPVEVTVDPPGRRAGDLVTVTVRLRSRAGTGAVGPLHVSASAVGMVEPAGAR